MFLNELKRIMPYIQIQQEGSEEGWIIHRGIVSEAENQLEDIRRLYTEGERENSSR